MSSPRDHVQGAETTCPHCGGLGLVSRDVPPDHPDFGKAFPCICQAEAVRQREATRLRVLGNMDMYAAKTFGAFEIDFELLESREQYLTGFFANLSGARRNRLNEIQRRSLNAAAELALRYADDPRGWLLFEGSYGAGKTHLAAGIGNYRLTGGHSVLFMTVPDLLDHLRGTFGPNSEIAYDELFERVRRAPLLILDDLGAENQSGWAVEKLYQLFNDRHRSELPTIVTTNRDRLSIEPRIRSRLMDASLTQIVPLRLPDRRAPGSGAWAESDLTDLSRYTEMTFETFDMRTNEGLKDADLRRLSAALMAARSFAARPEGWLSFIGEPGSGKTHLAAGIAHEMARTGTNALFVTAPDLLNHLRAAFSPDAARGYDARLEEIKRAPVLILDDLVIHERGTSPWAREAFYAVLIHRFDYHLPTVITSRQKPDEMDARLRSRIYNESRGRVLTVTVPAYMGRRR